jgi:hypothetical protein
MILVIGHQHLFQQTEMFLHQIKIVLMDFLKFLECVKYVTLHVLNVMALLNMTVLNVILNKDN